MIECTVKPGNTYQNHGAGAVVSLPLEEAKQKRAEGVLHFEDPPKPTKRIEVKEEKENAGSR